jgi:hypothetical protein
MLDCINVQLQQVVPELVGQLRELLRVAIRGVELDLERCRRLSKRYTTYANGSSAASFSGSVGIDRSLP